jgi:hypothetical protein
MRTRVVGRGSIEIMANADWDEVVEPKVSRRGSLGQPSPQVKT